MISVGCMYAAIAPRAAQAQGAYPLESYSPGQSYPPSGPPPSFPSSSGFKRFEPRYTLSLFLGARFGGKIAINTPNVDYLPIRSSLNWGFNAGVRVVPHLFAEFMWNRQTT